MDFKAPTDWEPMEDDGAARDPAWLSRHALVAVPLDSDLAVSLRQKLRESLPHARMVSLERIQHRGLWRAYARKRDDVAFYNDSDANEILLWHGTGERAPAAVLAHQEGLDPRFSSGGFYGQGIYLAERAAYPVGGRYAHRVAGHGGTRFQLLLVRVAAGRGPGFWRRGHGGDEKDALSLYGRKRAPVRLRYGRPASTAHFRRGRTGRHGRVADMRRLPGRPDVPGLRLHVRFVVRLVAGGGAVPPPTATGARSGMSPASSPVSPGVPARRAAVPQPATPSPTCVAAPTCVACWCASLVCPGPTPPGATDNDHSIAQLLIERKGPNPPPTGCKYSLNMARRLEESLFRAATSFEEYRDTSTLKLRLQAHALAIARGCVHNSSNRPPDLRPRAPRAESDVPHLDGPLGPAGEGSAVRPRRLRGLGPGLLHGSWWKEVRRLRLRQGVEMERLRQGRVPEYTLAGGRRGGLQSRRRRSSRRSSTRMRRARASTRDLRFLLDGKRLNGDQTPEDVDVEDGDQIDVFEDAFSASLRAAKRPASSPSCKVRKH